MDMLNCFKWPTLQERRHDNRLSQFHKIVYQLTPSNATVILYLANTVSNPSAPSTLLHQPSQLYFNVSEKFFLNTLREWNSSPNKTIEEQSPEAFLNNLTIKQWN